MTERQQISFTFWTMTNIKDENIGIKLSQLFLERNDELKPEFWWGGKYDKVKVNETAPKQFIGALIDFTENHGFLEYTRYIFSSKESKSREFIFYIQFGGIPETFFNLSFSISHEYFTTLERITKIIDIMRQLILLLDPFHGSFHDVSDSINCHSRNQVYDIPNKIPRVYWGNYFGEMYLQKITKKKLESFEGYKNKKIGNGRYIQLTESPFDFNTKIFKKKQKELEKLIGKKFLGYREVKLPY